MDTHRFEIRAATEDELNNARACLTQHAVEVGAIVSTRSLGGAWTMWDDDQSFSVLAISQNQVVGGLIGRIFFSWLAAELVWVEKPFRRSGIGKDLLCRAEERARELRLVRVYLWTESWQASEFYRRLGYEQFAEFDNFPPGHKRLGFRKYL